MNSEWVITPLQWSIITALTFVIFYPLFCEFWWWLFTRGPSRRRYLSLDRLIQKSELVIGRKLLPVCKNMIDKILRILRSFEK